MPLLGQDDGMETVNAGNFQFSAAKIERLGSDHFTLGNIVVDISGSLSGHEKDLEAMLVAAIEGCQKCDEADSLLVRVTTFSDDIEEVHGYKLMPDLNVADYKGIIKTKANTSLYEAFLNAIESSRVRGKELVDNNYNTNGVVYVITDGMDNLHKATPKQIRDAVKRVKLTESLESIVTICIGVNTQETMCSDALREFCKEADITHYLEIGNVTAKSLAKLGGFISKSLSSSSQAVGSGSPSQMIAPGTNPQSSLTI